MVCFHADTVRLIANTCTNCHTELCNTLSILSVEYAPYTTVGRENFLFNISRSIPTPNFLHANHFTTNDKMGEIAHV